MTTISVETNEILPFAIHITAGLCTVICLYWCAATANTLPEMVFWVVAALIAFTINRFGSRLVGRMVASSIGLR